MYDPVLFSRAQARKSERRAARAALVSRRRADIYAAVPRISEIDNQMQSGLLRAVRAAFVKGVDGETAIAACRERNMSLKSERSALLLEHDFPIDALEDSPECLRCEDTGFVDGKPCACLKRIYIELQTEVLSQKLDLHEQSFHTFALEGYSTQVDRVHGVSPRDNMSDVRDCCVSYARSFGADSRDMMLRGGPGLGKTFLCACLAGAVSEKALWVVYDTAAAVVANMEREKFSRDADAAEQSERLFDCDLLLLDDLGAEFITPFAQTALHHLLSTRLSGHKKTVVATALTDEEMRKRYTPQLVSRLESFWLLPLFGADQRSRP